MPLATGARIGPYEIVSQIGAGGMGEVYRARDTKLKRDVAIKVLPEQFTSDPERLARFQREAEVLATLNHPHIAQIYGFESSQDVNALVMELVDGEDLAQRLGRGPIPLDDALPIARQIAEALEAAHEQGVVHRDLKPANIKAREDGTVKVLDFGLAKIAETGGQATAVSPGLQSALTVTQSPVITTPAMTQAGMVLGTAAYMSPEQAKGMPADKRSDVWAFGCVLYEMLTGDRPFKGDDVADTLAAVLRAQPDMAALPASTPADVRRLLDGCLRKDRRERIGDVSTVRWLLTASQEPAIVAAPGSARWRWALGAALLALSAAAFVGFSWISNANNERDFQVTRYAITPGQDRALAFQNADRDIAISPDGRVIGYRGGPNLELFLKRADQVDPVAVKGTRGVRNPFFSYDSRWVGFWQSGGLYKVQVSGGSPALITQINGPPRGASWGDDNRIVFATNDPSTGLMRVAAGGGQPEALTDPEPPERPGDHHFPSVLPGSRAVLFTVVTGVPDAATIDVLDLQSGQRSTLVRGGAQGEYLAPGYLAYVVEGGVRAVRFDPTRLVVNGEPVPVLDGVMTAPTGAGNVAFSRTGTLVYVSAAYSGLAETRSLIWVDRQGKEEPLAAPPRTYTSPRLSPDESQIAVEIRDQENDIWIWQVKNPAYELRRLTFDPSVQQQPVWTPDGQFVVFSSSRSGAPNLFRRAADGSGDEQQLTHANVPQFPGTALTDGRVVGYQVSPSQFLATFEPQSSSVTGVSALRAVMTSWPGLYPALSPDGRYVAFMESKGGAFEVFLRPFPNLGGGVWQVSSGGGARPVWARDGRELFYLDATTQSLKAAKVDTSGPAPLIEAPVVLFQRRDLLMAPVPGFDVSRSGRFLLIKRNLPTTAQTTLPSITVVEHWAEELRQQFNATAR